MMPHTMTPHEEALRRRHWHGESYEILWAELDAERAAHEVTRAKLVAADAAVVDLWKRVDAAEAKLAAAEKWAAFGAWAFELTWDDGSFKELWGSVTQTKAAEMGILRKRTPDDQPCGCDYECDCCVRVLPEWKP